MESSDQLKKIFSRYLRNECSPEELKVLLRHFDTGENEEQLRELIQAQLNKEEVFTDTAGSRLMSERVFQRVTAEIEALEEVAEMPTVRRRFHWMKAAAILIATTSVGLFIYLRQPKPEIKPTVASTPAPAPVKNDIAPGGNKATLTLSDGRVIVLNETSSGVIATQNATSIKKTMDGEIEYTSIQLKSLLPVYNTISTPRGGEYKVTLPDGTQVWLNASSSLKFPTAFTGQQRNVELTGEAYFEVARNERMPFRVFAKDTEIEVLGTHFNVMAYNDEPELKATLLEGSVRVAMQDQTKILVPGQQARVSNKITVVQPSEDAIAWKKGFVSFEDTGIESIMRKVSRWYDVDVSYKGRINPRLFTGTIRKNVKLSELLRVLEANDIRFQLKGRELTVIH